MLNQVIPNKHFEMAENGMKTTPKGKSDFYFEYPISTELPFYFQVAAIQ